MFHCFNIIRARAPPNNHTISTTGRSLIDNNIIEYMYMCFSNHTLVVSENVVKRYIYCKRSIAGIVEVGGRNEVVVQGFIFFDGRSSVFYQLIKYCVYTNYYRW